MCSSNVGGDGEDTKLQELWGAASSSYCHAAKATLIRIRVTLLPKPRTWARLSFLVQFILSLMSIDFSNDKNSEQTLNFYPDPGTVLALFMSHPTLHNTLSTAVRFTLWGLPQILGSSSSPLPQKKSLS